MDRSFGLGKLNRGLTPRKGLIILPAALLLALAAVTLGSGPAGSASASSGGIGLTSVKPAKKASPFRGARFGARTLREGMTGPDVRVLKGIVRSKRLLRGRPLTHNFDRPTTTAVRRFQRASDMRHSGVVNKPTARALIRSLGTGHASWYGPGLYGNGTACGKVTLRPRTIGLAHKTLPCGTRVLIGYRGRYIIAPVIDRGPYIAGRTWDLTAAAARAVGLTSAGVGTVRHAIVARGR